MSLVKRTAVKGQRRHLHCASSTARRPVCRLAPHALTPCPPVACAMPQQSSLTLCTSMDRHDVAHSLEPTLWYWPLACTQIATQRSRHLFSAPSARAAALWLERVVRASPSHSRLELCRRRRVPTISLTGRNASRHEAEAHASFGFDPLHKPYAYAETNGRITGCATKVSNPPKQPDAAVCNPQRRLPQLGQEMAPLSDGRTCVVGETS